MKSYIRHMTCLCSAAGCSVWVKNCRHYNFKICGIIQGVPKKVTKIMLLDAKSPNQNCVLGGQVSHGHDWVALYPVEFLSAKTKNTNSGEVDSSMGYRVLAIEQVQHVSNSILYMTFFGMYSFRIIG